MNKEKELIDKLIDLAFAEDIGMGIIPPFHVFPLLLWENQNCLSRRPVCWQV